MVNSTEVRPATDEFQFSQYVGIAYKSSLVVNKKFVIFPLASSPDLLTLGVSSNRPVTVRADAFITQKLNNRVSGESRKTADSKILNIWNNIPGMVIVGGEKYRITYLRRDGFDAPVVRINAASKIDVYGINGTTDPKEHLNGLKADIKEPEFITLQ